MPCNDGRYALVLTYNLAYFPALNAMLNALEYYGHDDLDVHVIFSDDLAPKVPALQNAGFPMNLQFHPIEPLKNPAQSLYMNYKFCKYNHVQSLTDYDAFCHLDGDVLLLTSLMPYFKIAAKTDLILCATFPHTTVKIDHFATRDPDWVAASAPLANFPIFYSPRHLDMMRYCWEHMPPAGSMDRLRNRELYAFNCAVHSTHKLPSLLPLPGNLWIGDKYLHCESLYRSSADVPLHIYNALGDEQCAIHHKFWKEGVAEGEILRSEKDGVRNEVMRRNITLMQDATNFFNTGLRTKYP